MRRRLSVAFLWHMHQPAYVNLAEGRATMPWARLHALKEYFDMPAIARRFPTVGQTFNLVPCLVDQIEAYAEGRLTDPYLEVASRRARDLTRDDRLFLLSQFFSFHPRVAAGRLPRLEELRIKRGARPPEPEGDAALAAWREADYRDLQVLFHLAWSGAALSGRPEVSRLIAKGRGYTDDDLRELLDVQREFMSGVLEEYAAAASEGTIELSASPYYHPILPLLCDSAAALEATPRLPLPTVPFRHPEDARLQVRLARDRLARRFGTTPGGMWPSEGAVSDAALGILAEERVAWTASDEDVLFASLGSPAPAGPAERSRVLHRPYLAPGGTVIFFRDHALSDRIGFVYQAWDPEAAAADLFDRLADIARIAPEEDRVVSIILDGENPWESYPDGGQTFLATLFQKLSRSDEVVARTFASVLAEGPAPENLGSVRAGSWIGANLSTWIGHPEKNRAWELLAQSRTAVGRPVQGSPAGESLLAAEGSDWFWWYGDDHSAAHDAEFDRTFRVHLRNAHVLSGHDAPVVLDKPIAQVRGRRAVTPPTGRLAPQIDGRAGDYFEWLAAGRADAGLGGGTMGRGARLLRTVRFGEGEGALVIRLDTFAETAAAVLDGLVAVLEFASPAETRLRVPLRRGPSGNGAIHACLDRVLELCIPFHLIGATDGSRIEFRLVLEDAGGKPLESIPEDGLVSFSSGSEETDWIV